MGACRGVGAAGNLTICSALAALGCQGAGGSDTLRESGASSQEAGSVATDARTDVGSDGSGGTGKSGDAAPGHETGVGVEAGDDADRGDGGLVACAPQSPWCPAASGSGCVNGAAICSLDALPNGLGCVGAATCTMLIDPCPNWKLYRGSEETDSYVCSCVGGRLSCAECAMGAGICVQLDAAAE